MSVKITTLIENNQDDNCLLYNEHGLSLYIEADGKKIIFDTGQTGIFIENAKKLNIDLKGLDYVIISHGHYDHSGGFTSLVKEIDNPYKLVISEKFFDNKFSHKEKEYKYTGNSFDNNYLQDNNIQVDYVNEDMHNISENIVVVSNFERKTSFENLNDRFFVKINNNLEKDSFLDEISLAIKLKEGLLVILGCSHVGVVNILETLSKRTNMPIYGIVGGTHLVEADEFRLNKTIKYFKEKDIKIIAVSHCTGEKAIERLKNESKDRFLYNNTGNILEI